MSWLSSICKKISKIQPGKVIVNAAKSIAKNLPVVGGLVGGAQGAAEVAASQQAGYNIFTQAADTVGNVNSASKTMKYVFIAIGALVLITVLVLVMRKR
jgi:hypothetical protein